MKDTQKVFEPKLKKKKMSKGKKTVLISVTAAVLAVALIVGLALLLAPAEPALSYHGITLDKEMYAFWFSVLKSDFMIRYGLSSRQDTPEHWARVCPLEGADGRTWGEILNAEIAEGVKRKLVAAVLYDELGLTMTEGQRRRVNEYYSDMLEYVADGDKGELRELLSTYKTSIGAMKRCAVLDLKAELLYHHLALSGASGMGTTESERYLTTAELNSYYLDNYARVKIVYINNDETGISGVGARNDADKAELDSYCDANGRDLTEALFDEYVARSDEALHGEEAYPNGVYATINSELEEGGFLEDAVAEAVRGATPGHLQRVETEAGVRYVYGYALDSGAYLREESKVFFGDFFEGAARKALEARSAASSRDVEVFAEAIRDLTVETVPLNLKFRLCTMD